MILMFPLQIFGQSQMFNQSLLGANQQSYQTMNPQMSAQLNTQINNQLNNTMNNQFNMQVGN